MQDDANRLWRARMETEKIEREAREEESRKNGIRLQDAVVGQLYRITALYYGESDVFEYAGCTGSHDHRAHGVEVGAVAYFKHLESNCHYLHTTSQLEPGGRRAQYFMVPLTDAPKVARL